ncbi:rhodanese-like domain-containing protein [Lacibacter sp.]|jgi:rhodanese-related sulfurtransferase|uniref:rhodanese-like domain-containing protein n=1 Tax=Lacibacter sp. TaxID=1915409 RepID=UPI002B4AE1F1|nr:rhodanese-like domain-containing protein [Lacibacter sp.]HLP37887.1 rhodanese-like domain-containing protein [Lacibacter sp.]
MNLKEIVQNPQTKFVDVRSREEFADGHFPGATNIPLPEIAAKANELKAFDSPVVLYCRSGARSMNAYFLLKQLGLENVHNAGGLQDLLTLKNLN